MTVGQRIKQLRESIGISQVSLADLISEKKQTIYKYENNIVTNIPIDKIEMIAKALNTTPAYLMGWNDQIVREIQDTSVRKKQKLASEIVGELSQEAIMVGRAFDAAEEKDKQVVRIVLSVDQPDEGIRLVARGGKTVKSTGCASKDELDRIVEETQAAADETNDRY